jgi:hypothetical protein
MGGIYEVRRWDRPRCQDIPYRPNFIKICSAIQRLMGGGGGYTDTPTAWRSHKPTLIFQNKESRLKTVHWGDASSYAKCAILTAPKQEDNCNGLEERNYYNNNNCTQGFLMVHIYIYTLIEESVTWHSSAIGRSSVYCDWLLNYLNTLQLHTLYNGDWNGRIIMNNQKAIFQSMSKRP